METPCHVLLLSADPFRQRAWRTALAGTEFHLLTETDLGSQANPRPKLVVTDGPSPEDPLDFPNSCAERGQWGVICVGAATPADISLPSDCSGGELRIACQLLAEVVDLRRQRRSLLQRQNELSQLAYQDPLTGLPNRRAWNEQFPERARIACERHQPLCLALLDLDHFKQLNDRLGHRAGDRMLQGVGHTLAERSTPERDFVARLGGDEFAWLIAGMHASDAVEQVESIRAGLAPAVEANERITASAGLACVEELAINALENLFDAADRALRDAKAQGRNRTISTTESR